MAQCPEYRAFVSQLGDSGAAEIGMHLHAWNTPPLIPLTPDDDHYRPYLIEYPEEVIEGKVEFITRFLEETFGVKPRSHRAGRWSFDSRYARILNRIGYSVDCSVVPHVSYQAHTGDPRGQGGTDFRGFPSQPYFLDLDDIRKSQRSGLLEVPMTILSVYPAMERLLSSFGYQSLPRRVFHRVFRGIRWLRPNGRNLADMLGILDTALAQNRPYVEFMLHSSEFMPGGSPTFPTDESIENLYRHLEVLFQRAATNFVGATLSEFHEFFQQSRARSASQGAVR